MFAYPVIIQGNVFEGNSKRNQPATVLTQRPKMKNSAAGLYFSSIQLN